MAGNRVCNSPVIGRSAPTLDVAMSLYPPIDRVAARFATWVV